MQNSSWLTKEYPDEKLWTSCIYDFFCRCKPELPISASIKTAFANGPGPWYQLRERSSKLKIDGEILREPAFDEFLPKIGAMFGLDLMIDADRFTEKGDIAGIEPDIIIIKANRQGVYIIENKPFDWSTFNGNQGPGGTYIDFIKWLNNRDVPCDYLLIHSIGWNEYQKIKQIQDELPNYFGSLLLEDIFRQKAVKNFTYPGISQNWIDFTDKGSDFA